MKNKIAIAVTAFALVLCFAIGGTIAWLVDTTDPVENTFTYGDINISLSETTTDYKMVPGDAIEKDPEVTVKAGSEACWLFVQVTKSDNFDTFMTYGIDSNWAVLGTPEDHLTTVYYYNGTDLDTLLSEAKTYSVLSDDKVTVKADVTKAQLSGFDNDKDGVLSDEEKSSLPKLTFQAYAIQKASFATAESAWAEASK